MEEEQKMKAKDFLIGGVVGAGITLGVKWLVVKYKDRVEKLWDNAKAKAKEKLNEVKNNNEQQQATSEETEQK